MEAQTTKISAEVVAAMDAPNKLEELSEAVLRLAKGKVPGQDGIPAEFYIVVWDHIGPILLEIIQEGLQSGTMHPHITCGIIVLLKKKGDQLLLDNKRGLTLLNYILKILTKLYQLRLNTILQDFISKAQSASLSGPIHPPRCDSHQRGGAKSKSSQAKHSSIEARHSENVRFC